jgi:hypothetical protein
MKKLVFRIGKVFLSKGEQELDSTGFFQRGAKSHKENAGKLDRMNRMKRINPFRSVSGQA